MKDLIRRIATGLAPGLLGLKLLSAGLEGQSAAGGVGAVEAGSRNANLASGLNQKLVSRVVTSTNRFGREETRTNSYWHYQPGIHFRDSSGKLREARAEFVLRDGMAVAESLQHKVRLAPSLRRSDATTVQLPDGRTLTSHVVAIRYVEVGTGKSSVLGSVRESRAQLLGGNQVIYPDAFDTIAADVRYSVTTGGVEQDIILRESPPAPESLGLDSGKTRIEVLTEFLNADFATTEPARVEARVERNGLPSEIRPIEREDLVIRFGSMQIDKGRAFALGDASSNSLPVGKRWIVEDGRRFLAEAIEYQPAKRLLDALPRNATRMTSIDPGTESEAVAVSVATAEMQRAVQRPGLVLDYLQTLTPQPLRDFVFQGDMTYYIDGDLFLDGNTTLEGGAVLKYPPLAGSIWLIGPLNCKTSSHRPAVLTGRDDDTVGIRIDSSTGFLAGTYASRALGWWYNPHPIDLHDVRFVHLSRAMEVRSLTENRFHSLQVVSRTDYSDPARPQISNRGEGMLVTGGTNHVYNCLFSFIDRPFIGYVLNQQPDANTLTDDMSVLDLAYLTAEGCYAFCTPSVVYYLVPEDPPGKRIHHYRSFADLRVRSSIIGRPATFNNPLTASFETYTDGAGSQILDEERQTTADANGNFWPLFIGSFISRDVAGHFYIRSDQPVVYRSLPPELDPGMEFPELKSGDYTTVPPVALQPSYSKDLVLGTRVEEPGEAWKTPGYHYPRVDYLSTGTRIDRSVTLTNGVCVGWGYFSAFDLNSEQASLISIGTPESLNRIVNLVQVQEDIPLSGGIGAISASNAFQFVDGNWKLRVPSCSRVELQFTELNVLSGGQANLFALYGEGAALPVRSIRISDCQFHGVLVNYSPMNTVPVAMTVRNNLFDRGLLWVGDAGWGGKYAGTNGASVDLEVSNNLFYHLHYPPDPNTGWVIFSREARTPKQWVVTDNVFDSSVIQTWGGFIGTIRNNGFSSHVPAFGDSPVTADVAYVAAEDGFGPWYQSVDPATGKSPFSNQGSRSASEASLVAHTARSNQVRVVGDKVDLGFHYVASQRRLGVPVALDSDADQIPDYLEDSNENGVVDSNESDPRAASSPPRRLGLWQFSTDTFANESGSLPMPGSGAGVQRVDSFDGSAAQFGPGSQPLVYRVVEEDGRRNVDFLSGTIRFTYVPNWMLNRSRRPSHPCGLFQCGRWKLQVVDAPGAPQLQLFTILNDGHTPTLTLPMEVPTTGDLPQGERWGYEIQVNYNGDRVWASITKGIDMNVKSQAASESGVSVDVSESELASGLRIGGVESGVGGENFDADGFIDQFETFNVPTERIIVASNAAATPVFQFSSAFGELWKRSGLKQNSIRATDTGSGIELEWTASWEGDWTGTAFTNSYRIFRRELGSYFTLWDSPEVEIVKTDARTGRWLDTSAVPGKLYEYRIGRLQTSPRELRGEEIYEYVPREHPTLVACRIGDPIGNRGTVFLVVEESLLDPAGEANAGSANPMTSVLAEYRDDLLKDGWRIQQISSKRMNDEDWYVPTGRQRWHDNLMAVKRQIHDAWAVNPNGNYQIVLLGRVPIPYSGHRPADGHTFGAPPDHSGAWPSDVFYGDMSHMEWQDLVDPIFPSSDPSSPFNSCPFDCEDAHPLHGDGYSIQLNAKGDFKYDNQILPSDLEGGPGGQLEIPVGRIDFAALEYYANPVTILEEPRQTIRLAEYQLLKRYLAKVHRYKTGRRTFPDGIRVFEQDGNFFDMNSTAGTILDRVGYGRESLGLFKQDLFAQTTESLWGVYGGFSSRTTIQGSRVENYKAEELAQGLISPRCGFLFLRGSHFVDWNLLDDLALHCLALTNDVLSVSWVGDSYSGVFAGPYQVDPLAAGLHVGAMQQATYNRLNVQDVTANYILGDPTLRMKYVAPPSAVIATKQCDQPSGGQSASADGFSVQVSWNASADSVDGYAVYRNETSPESAGSAEAYQLASNWVLKGTVPADTLRFIDASGGLSTARGAEYLVKAIVKTRTGSGGYACPSLGSVGTADLTAIVCP